MATISLPCMVNFYKHYVTSILLMYKYVAHIYHIALNYGPGVYFFSAIFIQTTKRDKRSLVEDSHAIYNSVMLVINSDGSW